MLLPAAGFESRGAPGRATGATRRAAARGGRAGGAARGGGARARGSVRMPPATHAWVAKLVDARDLRKLSTRLGNGRCEWGQSRWNSSTSGWLQYRAKPWFGACSGRLIRNEAQRHCSQLSSFELERLNGRCTSVVACAPPRKV